MNLKTVLVSLSVLAASAIGVRGDDQVAKPASRRFADSEVQETPDFQKHVLPLLGRLGCNGRSCHGSFQGRGGFRLSLFGYDFKLDHTALTAKATVGDGRRVDMNNADQSLLIRKSLLQVDHGGGDRFAVDSWEHHLLQEWIAAGAKGIAEPRELLRLEIEPREIVFGAEGEEVQLRVTAVWKEGEREDVTPLCRFRTNDDLIVAIDEDGKLTATGRGDTHVVAFYDNGVAAIPVMRALTDLAGDRYPEQAKGTKIDGFINAKLRKLGVVPSPVCSDAEFLRRVSIDLTGTLPTPGEVREFLADASGDKRNRKIDELLERPAYAAWWTNRLCDFTGCNPSQQAELGQETAVQWYMWVYSRVQENMPYDELIASIVEAQGRGDGQSYDDYAAETTDFFRKDGADFAKRETMPHY